ncbi:unnamed protein product [Peronospora belbahrii]|uniref:Uncharacterized protein n=1 Tax=Peronospora belbahrii TaxID=622444 RepID=A0ABN8D1K1_9STRA|nr:unnamed protein product [Peronospora belbahrii]
MEDRIGWRRAHAISPCISIRPLVLLTALLFSLNNFNGKTLAVAAATSPLRQSPEASININNNVVRLLAGGAYEVGSNVCNNPASFLGVGNTNCLHENLWTAVFLLAVIVAVSIGVDRLNHYIRAAIKCPQLRKIVNRIFEEVMIMGFLSMVIFILNTSGAMMSLALDNLTASEKLHFYEFFHYIVFLTMIYFIFIVLLLLFIGTVVPKLVWEIQNHSDQRRDSISDIHNEGAYQSQFPSFTGSSSDYGGNKNRMRHSFIRDASSLNRDLLPHTMGSSIVDDAYHTLDTPAGDYYVTTRTRQCSDGDGVYRSMAIRARALSGMDLVMGSRAYSLLLQRYHREGWCFHFNIRKQWNLWKSFEILAYNICQHRSGYIYKNPLEMERLFGVRPTRFLGFQDAARTQGENGANDEDNGNGMTYAKYHVLCMRNLLLHVTNIPPIAFLILIIICLLPSIFPDQDHWISIGVGGLLLLLNVVIFFKVLKILRGIVDDRLRIISMRDIQTRLAKALKNSQSHDQGSEHQHHNISASGSLPVSVEASIAEDFNHFEENGPNTLHNRHKKAPKRFKAAALAVRAVIRMQMSALCHRQLHYHDDRFWFNSPKFLLRFFQFATIGQAFYLVWLSLVEIPSMADSSASDGGGSAFLTLMIVFPALSLLVITPLTMPSLVLVMSLTGIFVDLNASNGGEAGNHRNVTQEDVKTHTRIMRRTFLKSHYTERGSQLPSSVTPPLGPASPCDLPNPLSDQQDAVGSPTNVFLRIYDSPVFNNVRRVDSGPRFFSANSDCMSRNNSPSHSRNGSKSVGSIGNASGDNSGYSSRRAFDLVAFQSMGSGALASTVPEKTCKKNNHQAPPQSASSFTSSTSSAYGSPRPCKMDITAPGAKMRQSQGIQRSDVQVGNTAVIDNNELRDDLEQAQSPASASFKSYCSKYGGYPDL